MRHHGGVSDALITSLLAAVEARPDDVPLRVHLAGLLVDAGRPAEALAHVGVVLAASPGDAGAAAVLARATAALTPQAPTPAPSTPAPPAPPAPSSPAPSASAADGEFDWHAAEAQIGPVDSPFAQPAFVDGADVPDDDPLSAYDIERPNLTLADVGGMEQVKARLDVAFLTPLRNPELREAFGKSLRGGLLLWGPPGCGKTFIARALAGELGAKFASVSLADVLDMYIGNSERNIADLFRAARQAAPCVLFLDEVDAIGLKRTQMRGSAQRGSVNQLLTELDGAGSDNEGVFVLAATNAPWDVDPALRRPGRLDRMVLVLPPDAPAREAILRRLLLKRPVAGIDLAKLAEKTQDFSGADLAHLVETATERALVDSVARGEVRPVTMKDFSVAFKEVKPSIGPWLASARNVAEFGNSDGQYDELVGYLRGRRML